MKIVEKIKLKIADNMGADGVTIAFLGDSVTQGCFEIHRDAKGIQTVFDKGAAYHNYIAKIFSVLYPSVPINIINAGISGDNAPHGYERLEKDVLRHNPDLVVVCFGLNDVGYGREGLLKYLEALGSIFARLKKEGIEAIFMTPNMLNTEISMQLTDAQMLKIAENTKKLQLDGVFDEYINAAIKLCEEKGVKVCDCYKKWKLLEASGANVTELLANKINHPTREMNWLFAYSLVETMLN